LVGRSWCEIFVSFGYKVCLFDVNEELLLKSYETVKEDLLKFEKDGNLRNNPDSEQTAEQQYSLVSYTTDLKKALSDVIYLQECVPENIELKQTVWKNIEENLDFTNLVAVGSSTSCILPKILFSKNSEKLKNIAVVAHPVNPPYFVPLVEIIPDEICSETACENVRNMMEKVGQSPVVMKKQVDGFALNRLQYPVINAAWQLVRDGVMSAKDVDTVMTKGLGLRYACIGPFQTCHLNAEGIEDYFGRYTENIERVAKEQVEGNMAQNFKDEALPKIIDEMNAWIPLGELKNARTERDKNLTKIAKLDL